MFRSLSNYSQSIIPHSLEDQSQDLSDETGQCCVLDSYFGITKEDPLERLQRLLTSPLPQYQFRSKSEAGQNPEFEEYGERQLQNDQLLLLDTQQANQAQPIQPLFYNKKINQKNLNSSILYISLPENHICQGNGSKSSNTQQYRILFKSVLSWCYIGQEKWVAVVQESNNTQSLVILELNQGNKWKGRPDSFDILFQQRIEISIDSEGRHDYELLFPAQKQNCKKYVILVTVSHLKNEPLRIKTYTLNQQRNHLKLLTEKTLRTTTNRIYPIIFSYFTKHEPELVIMGGVQKAEFSSIFYDGAQGCKDYDKIKMSELLDPNKTEVESQRGTIQSDSISCGIVLNARYLLLPKRAQVYEIRFVNHQIKIITEGGFIFKHAKDNLDFIENTQNRILRHQSFRIVEKSASELQIECILNPGESVQAWTRSYTMIKKKKWQQYLKCLRSYLIPWD